MTNIQGSKLSPKLSQSGFSSFHGCFSNLQSYQIFVPRVCEFEMIAGIYAAKKSKHETRALPGLQRRAEGVWGCDRENMAMGAGRAISCCARGIQLCHTSARLLPRILLEQEKAVTDERCDFYQNNPPKQLY